MALTKVNATLPQRAKTKSWQYLFRVLLSFVLMILILDFIWSRLDINADYSNEANEEYWQRAFLSLVDQRIADTNPSDYAKLAEALSNELDLSVVIDSLDQLHMDAGHSAALEPFTLIELAGKTYLLARFLDRNLQVRVGPIPNEKDHWVSTTITLGFYLLVGLLIWFWIRPLIQGLDQLSEATQRFAQNYKEPLPELNLGSPVKELAESIDSMAERIRALIQTQVELTGGLSHEIRTPLARIKFALATARSRFGDQDQFDSMEQDVEELEHLVETMLDYSRLQQTEGIMQWQSMDAESLFTELTEKYQWRTGAKINFSIANSVPVIADPRLMPLAISNLLANATRYAKQQVTIHFSVSDTEQSISVSDDGPGIPEDQYTEALMPFKKNTDSTNQSDGFGLGLAIVNRIAKLHLGNTSLTKSELGGLQVTVCWPKNRP